MELILLNKSMRPVRVVDQFESLLWNERYSECGDFELYTPANTELLNVIKKGFYFFLNDSDQQMIVEDIKIETDAESSNHLIVSGRSLESILDRRIIWKTTKLKGNFQNAIKKLLDQNVISPDDKKRTIPNFVFKYSNDPDIRNLTISRQFTGDNLYDVIKELCELMQIGFRIRLIWDTNGHLTDDGGYAVLDDEGNQILTGIPALFEFSLYKGVDRSYDPFSDDIVGHLTDGDGHDVLDDNDERIITEIPSGSSSQLYPSSKIHGTYVVFSPKYDNVVSSEYLESSKTLKNVTLVAGEGEGYARRNRVVGSKSVRGLERRELYTDARDVQSELEDGSEMPVKDYYKLLDQRGNEKLAENQETTAFEYQVDPSLTYTYKEDYDKGDLVQVINEYGIRAKARITEIVRSYDVNGFYIYPTFSAYSDSTTSSYNDSYSGSGDSSGSDSGGGSAVNGLPSGGLTGQFLRKRSSVDYDARWESYTPEIDIDYEEIKNRMSYIHEQAVAANRWLVTHNLNCYPSVTVVDTANSVILGAIEYLSKNELAIEFSSEVTGYAYVG